MRYYHYEPDCSVAGLGAEGLTGDQLGRIYRSKNPLASRWKPSPFIELDPKRLEAGDFPVLYDDPRLPIFSQRAWDVLHPAIDCRWEALPIIHPSGKPFYLIHVMEVIDCVDHARSELDYYDDGSMADINRYCLKPELLVGKHIFRVPIASMGDLFVDDVFREVVENHKLKGLKFQAIPRVDAPEDGGP